jgi:hypothetical protein
VVSGVLVVAVPFAFVTATATGFVLWQGNPLAGRVKAICVAVALVTVAATPATVTALFAAPAAKFAPVIVAEPPGTSVVGAMDVMDGCAVPAGDATKTVAVPLIPSLSAVIVAEPAATAVTLPVESTLATAVALELQVTFRPVSTVPFRSLSDTASETDSPAWREPLGAVSVTLATADGVTVIVAVPILPSTVALIVAVPAAIAVTTPDVASTAATATFEELQTTAFPVIALPAWSRTSAARVVVPPTSTEARAGVTVTVVTAGTSCGGLVKPEGVSMLLAQAARRATEQQSR